MVRKNIYDIIKAMHFDVLTEYDTLMFLFKTEKVIPSGLFSCPLSEYINNNYFRSLPIRGTADSIDRLMEKIRLPEKTTDLDTLFLFCELLLALIKISKLKSSDALVQAKTILQNINVILDRTSHEIYTYDDGRKIIVEKNKATKHAAEIVADDEISLKLIEYNHFALKGDLSEKQKILYKLALYIEPILKSNNLKNNGYRTLESDVGFLLNNFHIRHNNKTGISAQDYIISLNDSQLETWYDKIYTAILSVIIINDHLLLQKELSELKAKYKWK